MKLHFKKIGFGEPLMIIHGLFGSSDNWGMLGKKFAEKFTVYLIDLRNHGRSPHSPTMNYELMADDLHEVDTWIMELNIQFFWVTPWGVKPLYSSMKNTKTY